MGIKPTSSIEIYFLMGFKEAFLFLKILFHPSKLCVIYVYVIFLNVCLLYILNKKINRNQRKNEKYFCTLEKESYLKGML